VDTQSTGVSSSSTSTGSAANVTPAATGELIFAAIELGGSVPAGGSLAVSGTGFVRDDAGGTAGNGWGSQVKAVDSRPESRFLSLGNTGAFVALTSSTSNSK